MAELDAQPDTARLMYEAALVIRTLQGDLDDARRRAAEAEAAAAAAIEQATLVIDAALWATLHRPVATVPRRAAEPAPSTLDAVVDARDEAGAPATDVLIDLDEVPVDDEIETIAVPGDVVAPPHRRPLIHARAAAVLVGSTVAVLAAVATFLPLHHL